MALRVEATPWPGPALGRLPGAVTLERGHIRGSYPRFNFLHEDLAGSEYFQAYPSTDRDLGSIAMDHRALLHHSFTSSPGKEQSAIQQ
jgi:hypothetical protein